MGNNTSVPNNLDFYVCINKNEAQTLLDNAERQDYYLEEVNDDKVNSLARKTQTYRANLMGLRDANYAITYLDGTKEHLPTRLLNDLNKVTIIQLMPTADGGMPHTRPNNIICYPDISQLFSKTTLIHELWHLHQRNFKDMWFKTFNKMGWNMWDGKLPENLENARRYNPDTLDCPFWIFDNEWVPIPVFRDISRPNVTDVEIWFYNINKQFHIKRVPESILSYFPGLPPSAYEHPREITAYMLSEPEKYKDSNGFKKLIESIGQVSIMPSENISK
jgi:hypothetical protein